MYSNIQSPKHSSIYMSLWVCVLHGLEGEVLLTDSPRIKSDLAGTLNVLVLDRWSWREQERSIICHFHSLLLGQISLCVTTQPWGTAGLRGAKCAHLKKGKTLGKFGKWHWNLPLPFSLQILAHWGIDDFVITTERSYCLAFGTLSMMD